MKVTYFLPVCNPAVMRQLISRIRYGRTGVGSDVLAEAKNKKINENMMVFRLFTRNTE